MKGILLIVCEWCGGDGYEPDGIEPVPCRHCDGKGWFDPDDYYDDDDPCDDERYGEGD